MGSLVSSGILDQRVTIQQYTNVKGTYGGHDETWSTFITVWAQTVDMTGREIYQAKEMGAAANVMVVTRYIDGITTAMRVLLPDGNFARIQWIRRVTRKERLELYCLLLNDD